MLGTGKDFLCLLFCFCFVLFVQNTLFVMNFAIPFAMLIYLVLPYVKGITIQTQHL